LEFFEYLKIWHNQKRAHYALNYPTIDELKNQINCKNAA